MRILGEMPRRNLLLAALFLGFPLITLAAAKHESQILIKLKDPKSFQFPLGDMERTVEEVEWLKGPNEVYLFTLKDKADVEKALLFLNSDPSVAHAERNHLIRATATPDDTDFATTQWNLNNIGQTIDTQAGTADIDINAPEMWDVTTGSTDIIIGVIDTGINYTHEDLAANVWVNPGEADPLHNDGIDNDGNGYIDDVHGVNVITGAATPGSPKDDNGHGSHVAGIIGAVGDNATGVSGVMQTVKIAGCKFLDSSGSGVLSDAIKCLNYFHDLKVNRGITGIVATNNSYSGGSFSQSEFDAIKLHMDEGILFIAAASNDGDDNDVTDVYPANHDLPNVISVAAHDNQDNLASFTNFGNYSVHLSGPGVQINSLGLANTAYGVQSGTSMAAPHVAGMAGILKAANPAWDHVNIRNALLTQVEASASANGKTITGGRLRSPDINAGVFECIGRTVSTQINPKYDFLAMSPGTIKLTTLHAICEVPFAGAEEVTVTKPDATQETITLVDDASGGDKLALDGYFDGSFLESAQTAQPGTYTLEFPSGQSTVFQIYDDANLARYRSADSTVNIRDMTGATALNAGDDTIHEVDLPSNFGIKFGDGAALFTKLFVSVNGAITLTQKKEIPYANETLPSDEAEILIAPLWDDWTFESTVNADADIYTREIGTTPNREFVVEWQNAEHYRAKGDPATFQVVFFEGSSTILFNYEDIEVGDPAYDLGASATVGVQITGAKAIEKASSVFAAPTAFPTFLEFGPNQGPVAHAGDDATVDENILTTLDASLSSDPDTSPVDTLSYSWAQTLGTSVTISNGTTVSPSFIPSVSSTEDLTFEVTVTDEAGDVSTDKVTITVTNIPSSGGGSSGGGSSGGGGSTDTDSGSNDSSGSTGGGETDPPADDDTKSSDDPEEDNKEEEEESSDKKESPSEDFDGENQKPKPLSCQCDSTFQETGKVPLEGLLEFMVLGLWLLAARRLSRLVQHRS